MPNHVAIRVYTEYGTINPTLMAIAQTRDDLIMPYTFMQTQPGQLFNAIGTALNWHGDGYTTSSEQRQQTELTLLQGIKQSALLAWVDEVPELISRWIWLEKTDVGTERDWQPVDSIFQTSDHARWLKIDADESIFQAG